MLITFFCFFCAFFPPSERESQEEARVTEVTEELLPPAKVPLFPRDHINSKKAQAMRKDRKRQQAKLRTVIYADHPPLALDKHQPEFVSPTATKTTRPLLMSRYQHTNQLAK